MTGGANRALLFEFIIDNVNEADSDGIKELNGSCGAYVGVLDRSAIDIGLAAAAGVMSGWSARAEAWDEIRVGVDSGNFEGSDSDKASEIRLWGHKA